SWLWKKFFYGLRAASQTWAATGIVDADGGVDHVVLEPKIRALLRNTRITDVLTPWQAEAKQNAIERVAATPRRSAARCRTPAWHSASLPENESCAVIGAPT